MLCEVAEIFGRNIKQGQISHCKDTHIKDVLYMFSDTVKPVFTKSLDGTHYVGQGMKHVLECDATGLPTPSITWLRDGKPFLGNDEDKVTFNNNHTR